MKNVSYFKNVFRITESFSDFKEVAKVALRQKPQLIEKLGWKEE